MGAKTSYVLTFWNAWSNSSNHVNSFLVQNSGLSSDSSLEIVEVEVDNWLTSPKNKRRSMQLARVGKFVMVCVMDGST